ncbi:hypothetical protein HUK80_14950 [Flavobacterium sp. MAH-1]|uniref:Ig-like domain-containing protein n=1 Tax=Flavobacterium agri TaxID=2743471 RepID=A0A7Y9C6L5_9FLAO|nr:hypothetical protein [Flavobacterium agri]NUY82201.1 hypothetical protein [Flavobacterium agri]NYA72225.1 hypothetical protein [Flavobacterium agri]
MKPSLSQVFIKFCFSALLLLAFHMSQAQIASWTYEPYQGTLNNPTPNTGSGSSAVVNNGGGTIGIQIRTGMAGTGCGAQNGSNAWAMEPFDPGSSNEANGVQFSASTVGYQNINFTWDQRWSNTAPNTVRLQYTLNGSTWTNFTMTAANTTFCNGSINNGRFQTNTSGDQYRRISVNLSAITGANNNADFGVRLMAAYYQATTEFRRTDDPTLTAGTAGTWRFDNVAITGTVLPGPTASVMSGTTSICIGGSANIKVQITGGTGPYTLVYTNGTTNFTVNNYASNANISVSPTSTTTYSIVSVTAANGAVGTGNSGAAVITVNPLPTVSATNITTCSTGAVTLTGGSPAGGTYSIANPYSGPSTTFTYTYTNANGCTKTSATYTFTRNTAPAISAQPSAIPQSTCQNTAFSAISVGATGTGLSYQWYSNTTAATSGGTPLTSAAQIANGSQTASYTPLSTTVGTLYFYCIISGTCTPAAKTSISGAFSVIPGTVAGTVSSDQTICAGTLAADLNLTGHNGTIVKWQKADDVSFITNVSDIANNTATLPALTIGALTQTAYFRAVVQNATCTTEFSNAVEIAIRSTTWNGTSWSNGAPDGTQTIIFNGNYISSGDLKGCSAIVNSGNVNFQPDDTLTLLNGLTVNSGTLTFENNASLVQTNDVANSGAIFYKRDTTPIRKFDFTYWSSPVQNQLLIGVSPLTRQDKFFWFDANVYNWIMANPNTTLMQPGIGYIFRGPDDYDQNFPVVYHAAFNGVPNNGEYTVPVFVNGTNDFNLLGNPYPSALDADLFMSDPDNAASLGTGTTIYLWTHNTAVTDFEYVFSDYATYNYTGGTGTAPSSGANNNIPNGFIASGQSFFIQGIATGTAKFKNSMRVSGNNDQFYKNAAVQKDRFWLEFKNGQGVYKQALLGYMPNATNGFDNGFDGLLFESGITSNFYFVSGENRFSIEGRAWPLQTSDIVPLGYRASVSGTFEIDLMKTEGIFDNQEVFLEDLSLGVIHNLKDAVYSFSTEAGTFDNRFRIRYSDSALGNPDGISKQDIVVFKQDGNAVVKASGIDLRDVAVFDLNGKKLIEFINLSSNELSFPFELRNQVVFFQITTSRGEIVSRKVLF